jgi:molybdopterin molybdotransferase
MALLASQGIAEFEVGGAPRIAIVSTGDELAQLGKTPQPGQIFESNSIMLRALALAAGGEVAGRALRGSSRNNDRNLSARIAGDAFIISGASRSAITILSNRLCAPSALRSTSGESRSSRGSHSFSVVRGAALFRAAGKSSFRLRDLLKFVRPAL